MDKEEFEKKWLGSFAPGLTQQQDGQCFVGAYLWHAFSYEIVPKSQVLPGDEARQGYEAADKEGAVAIRLWWSGEKAQTAELQESQKAGRPWIKYRTLPCRQGVKMDLCLHS